MFPLFRAGCGSPRLLVAVLFAAASLKAQIFVGPFGSPANPFTNTPTADEWATRDTVIGASDTFMTPDQLDAWAQTLDQASITTTLPTTTSVLTSRLARHNTTQSFLVTQPAGVPAVILKATLRNNSGMHIYSLTVRYDFGVAVAGPAESAPGQRVFYSPTGQQNSWQLIPELSGLTAATNASAQLLPESWPPDSNLYLLWLDDNAIINPEGAYSIDNFAVDTVIPEDPTPIIITGSPQSLTVNERDAARFEVTAEGLPRTYYWFSNDVPVPGNNRSTFTIPSAAYPTNHNTEIYVVVSNSLTTVTSQVATLTVRQDATPPFLIRATSLSDLTTVLLTFSEPLHPDTVELSSFFLYETGGNPDQGVLITDAALNNGTNVVITTEARAHGNYSLRIMDVRDGSSALNLIEPNPTELAHIRQQIQLVGFDDNNFWNYNTETNLFGTGWEMPGYDDSGETWFSGPAGLGIDSSANAVPIRTTLPYLADSAPQFFRRHFMLPAGTNELVLTMRYLFEDGAVVFLNGQEAGRYNVGPAPLSAATRAIGPALDPTPISAPVTLPTTNVHPGDNVIAVVVIQSGATSSDIEMALELSADFPGYPAIRGPMILPNGQITITWFGGTLMETSQLLNGDTVWSEVPGNPTSPYIFTATPGTQRFFSIRP